MNKDKVYAYLSYNQQGKKVKSIIHAKNKTEAIKKCQLLDLQVISLHREYFYKHKKKKIKLVDLWLFGNQLYNTLNAAVPIIQALRLLQKQCKQSMKTILNYSLNQLESGHSFAAALKQYHQNLPYFFILFIEAGEINGNLASSLAQANHLLSQKIQLQRLLRKALTYPLIIIIVSFLIITAMIVFIIPQFQQMYSQMGSQLPMLTQVVLNTFQGIKNIAPILLSSILIIVTISGSILKKYSSLKLSTQKYLLNIPIIGSYLKLNTYIQWLSLTGSFLTAGIPLKKALKTSQDALTLYYFNYRMQNAIALVNNGLPLSQSLLQTQWMSQDDLSFIEMGEQSGELGKCMLQQASWLQDYLKAVMDSVSRLLEPLILVILAVIMGSLLIALYLPLFQMGQLF